MKKVTLASLVIAAVLAGCAATPVHVPVAADWNNPDVVASRITSKHDIFKKHTEFVGPNLRADFDSVFLRAWKQDATGETTYQIYIADYYQSEWRFYNRAYDSNGNSLNVTLISRDVGHCSRYSGCSNTEHVGVNVTKKYLESIKKDGIAIKLSGKAGEEVFYIPAGYIQAFLDVTSKKPDNN